LARSRAVVGGAAAPDDQAVGPGDTIEFLPPVSGG
jgi:molybdopterin converting factor small subunit